jgi:formylmethanofuran dehydrogenase subunit E
VVDIRQRAYADAPDEPRHYFAQMQAYQVMPETEMFTFTEVQLTTSVEAIISRPGLRVECDVCGEEIMNGREVHREGLMLCRACASRAYYQPTGQHISLPYPFEQEPVLTAQSMESRS